MGKLIYSERDLSTASEEIIKSIDKAVLATAFKVRDDARRDFLSSAGLYKSSAGHDYSNLSKGIMVGRLVNGEVRVHAFGDKTDKKTWKVRFFVGGTGYRKNSKTGAFTGYIKPNNAIDLSVNENSSTLNTYINNVLNK